MSLFGVNIINQASQPRMGEAVTWTVTKWDAPPQMHPVKSPRR